MGCIPPEGGFLEALRRITSEHGALLISREDGVFVAPAYPQEDVRDPTGAGDSFAGGFIGYLASRDDVSSDAIRRAIIHGCAVASFTVEDFGVRRLAEVKSKMVIPTPTISARADAP